MHLSVKQFHYIDVEQKRVIVPRAFIFLDTATLLRPIRKYKHLVVVVRTVVYTLEPGQ